MIYSAEYAARYARLYIAPWRRKHLRNSENLTRILAALAPLRRPVRWLDVACGPAWHFRQFPSGCFKVGLDRSMAQLLGAREAGPDAAFVCADMAAGAFAPASFDLVTNFWAGYCYLDGFRPIANFLDNLIGWVRPGGACYLEVLLPEDLAAFNTCRFAAATGFRVFARTPDFTFWGYRDSGGEHRMCSPPLGFFTAPLAGAFERLEAEHDGAFMVHLIAAGKRAPESLARPV